MTGARSQLDGLRGTSQTGRVNRTDHPRVAKWLENFSSARRDAAALLVDSLRLVSGTDLRREMGVLLTRLATDLPGPIAAFPAREVAKGEAAHGDGRDGGYTLISPCLPGSDAIIAQFLTVLDRRPATARTILWEQGLSEMRRTRAPTVFLVDDFSGSGSRLVEFERALRRHPTIRSWASGGLIQFHVAAYAATASAIATLERRFGPDRVHVLHPCPTFAGAGWTPEQLADVEELCRGGPARKKVARRRRGRPAEDFTFGFRGTRALIAFEHTAPNNLPRILWKTAEGWNSLFEYKTVPDDLLGLFTMTPGPDREPHAGAEGARRLERVIDLVAHRVKTPVRIAEAAGVSIAEATRLVALAKSLGLVGTSGRLTDAGMSELKRRRGADPQRVLPNHDDFYYPTQLRAER